MISLGLRRSIFNSFDFATSIIPLVRQFFRALVTAKDRIDGGHACNNRESHRKGGSALLEVRRLNPLGFSSRNAHWSLPVAKPTCYTKAVTIRLSPTELYPVRGITPTHTLLDVRSPTEVGRGALPHAVTLPILNDEERHQVGIRYKEAGQEEAVKLGYTLTGPHLPRRIEAWREVVARGPTAVTCWRGGLRSALTVDFIGNDSVPCVEGGYKAIRNHLMGGLEASLERYGVLVVGGLTGSGKTALLTQLKGGAHNLKVLDLEQEAKHRGSAFGRLTEPQPAQASFENSLAAQLLLGWEPKLLLEDESRTIGSLQLPDAVHRAIQTSPLVLVEEPLERRVARIHQEYVLDLSMKSGVSEARKLLAERLSSLKQRLSGAVLDGALRTLEDAETRGSWVEVSAHAGWIVPLLTHYYDPLYQKSLERAARPVIFRGDVEACKAWLSHLA